MSGTTGDDDIIILDDIDETEAVKDEPIIVETDDSADNDILSFDDEIATESPSILSDEIKSSENESDSILDLGDSSNSDNALDFSDMDNSNETSLDLGDLRSSTEDNTFNLGEVETSESQETNDSVMDLGESEDSSSELDLGVAGVSAGAGLVSASDDSSSTSMDDIISQTIEKLESRKEIVDSSVVEEQALEDDLSQKLAESQDRKRDLETESKNIKSNISKLEKMKSSELEKKTNETVKAHNSTRKKAPVNA